MKVKQLLHLAPLAVRLVSLKALEAKVREVVIAGENPNAVFTMDGVQLKGFDAVAVNHGIYQAVKLLIVEAERELIALGVEPDEAPKPDA